MLVGCRLLVVLPIQHWLNIGSADSALASVMESTIEWTSDCDDRDFGSMPPWAPLDADGLPGDIDDDHPDKEVINYSPKWNSVEKDISSSGTWETNSGSGDPCGRIGIYTGNWGANWTNKETQEHMLRDVKSSPCHILCLQEAEGDLMEYLAKPAGAVPNERA